MAKSHPQPTTQNTINRLRVCLSTHRYLYLFIAQVAGVLILGTFFISLLAIYGTSTVRKEFLDEARIIAATLDHADLSADLGHDKQLSASYQRLSDMLSKTAKADAKIRWSYLMVQQNGKVLFTVDAEPISSPDHVAPFSEYQQAPTALLQTFLSGQEKASKTYTDQWGTWVSAFIPIKDSNGQLLTVLGVDMTASTWSATVAGYCIFGTIIVCLFLFIVIFVNLISWRWRQTNHRIVDLNLTLARELDQRQQAQTLASINEEKYRNLYATMNEGVVLHKLLYDPQDEATDYEIMDANAAFATITGIKISEALGKHASQLYQTTPAPYLDIYANVVKTGIPTHFETEFSPMHKCFKISVFSPAPDYFATIFEDITEHKRAELELRHEKDNLNALFASSPVGLLLMDENLMIVESNQVLDDMLSRDRDNVIHHRAGNGLGCIHSLENVKGCGFSTSCGSCPLRQTLMQVVRDNVPVHRAEIQPTLDIQGIIQQPWLSVSAEPVLINGRKHLIVAIESITDRKQTEKELRDNEQLLNSIIENIPAMIFMKDTKNLQFKLLNKAGEAIFGKSKSAVLGKNDYDFFPRDQADFFTQKDREVLQHKQLVNIPEEPIETPNGTRFLNTKKIPLLGVDGNPEYLLGISTDITAQKNLQDELIRAKANVEAKVEQRTEELNQSQLNLQEALKTAKDETAKITTILDSIGDGVFVLDADRNIILANPVTLELSGFTRKDLLGHPYNHVLQFVDEKTGKDVSEFMDTVFTRGQVAEMGEQTLLIRQDGSKLPVADSAAPLKDLNGAVIGCVVVFRDATKQREIDHMKNEFVATASHQLRTPLTALRWILELLPKPEIGPLNPTQARYVDRLHASTLRLIDIVNDLLNLSRLENGKIDLKLEPINLLEQTTVVINNIRAMAYERGIKVECKAPPGPLPHILADRTHLQAVIQNLIANAVKYSLERGMVEVDLSLVGDRIQFKCRDDGIGIPKTQQKQIFSKFFRADNAIAQTTLGTGLGLAIAKMIIERMGGKIWFHAIVGKGSTFYFELPVARLEFK